MEDMTIGQLATTMEVLRKEISDLTIRIQLLAIDVESTRRHQISHRKKCISMLQELEDLSSKYVNFMNELKAATFYGVGEG